MNTDNTNGECLNYFVSIANIKPLFDHIRNFMIAGGVGFGSELLSEEFGQVNIFTILALMIALLLLALNAYSGAYSISQFLENTAIVKYRFLPAVIYFLVVIPLCIQLFLASMQRLT